LPVVSTTSVESSFDAIPSSFLQSAHRAVASP